MHIQSEAAPGSVLIKPGVKNLRGLLDYIETATGKALDKEHVRMMNPLVLAYIGDTVYDLFVRTYLIHVHDVPVHQLHIKSISYVKAESQSETLYQIDEQLTEEEKDIVRRGRNAKSGTIPKNADVADYRRATGFESLLGFLYLTRQEERLCQLIGYMLAAKADQNQSAKAGKPEN
jgi:ribonuclease-3 family protein